MDYPCGLLFSHYIYIFYSMGNKVAHPTAKNMQMVTVHCTFHIIHSGFLRLL